MASLAERTASPWTTTSIRDRPAGCSTCASSLCGALCGNGRSPAADVDGLLMPIGWRRRFGAAPAMMVPRRRGATNTTLAVTQRHRCRSGMVTADCARSRSRPETVVAPAALKDQRKIARVNSIAHPSRARGADDGGRRRRDASYGVARDSHRRKQGDWLTQPPYQAFAQRVSFQRTSTRQQLDCASTLLSRSQVNRRTPISDGLSACS
jgi:hypothetical protein